YNFLWPRQRYVSGLTQANVLGSDGKIGANPIFKGGLRTPDLVLFGAIVGVPLPLVQDATTGAPKVLSELDWEKIISPDLSKRDPHMIESIGPRAGIAKFSGDRSIDPINGGDRDVPSGDDLQYACIAKRATTEQSDDCSRTDIQPNPEAKNPLCAADKKQP